MNSKAPKAWLRGILDDEDPHGQVDMRLTPREAEKLAAIKARKSPGEQMKKLTVDLVVDALADGPLLLAEIVEKTQRSAQGILEAIRKSDRFETDRAGDGTRRLLYRLAIPADSLGNIAATGLETRFKSRAHFLFIPRLSTCVLLDDVMNAHCLKTGRPVELEADEIANPLAFDKLTITCVREPGA